MNRENILQRLSNADRAHQRERGMALLLNGLKWILAGVLGCFILDILLHLSPAWRFALLALLLTGSGILIGWSWYVARVRRNCLEHIARLLEERDPSLGSRLINLLQLRALADDATLAPLTRSLARSAIDGYSTELAATPLERLARTDRVVKALRRAGCALGIFALVLAIWPSMTRTEVARYADPFGDHPPYSLTQLELAEPKPEGARVIYGQSFLVQVKARGHRPKEVFLTAHPLQHPERSITLPMYDKGSAGFHQQLENVRSELVVYAHTKDRHSLSKQGRLSLILVPQLEKAHVQITPPPYTGIKPQEKLYGFKGVQALAGSQVRFRIQSNRPLREGALEIISGDSHPATVRLERTSENEVTGSFTAQDSGRMRITLVDVNGIRSDQHWESGLTVTHDVAPEIVITEPARDAFAALDFTMAAQFDANDDYGLKQVRIHRALNGVFSHPKEIGYTGAVRTVRETIEFSFRDLGVQPGDVISFFAEAIDTAPEPHLARTRTAHLRIISVEEYNNFLRERTDIAALEGKYQETMSQLGDLVEQQRQLGAEAERAREQLAKADPRQKEALQQNLDALLARQNELNQKLKKQADTMERLVRENPLYDVEREFQDWLKQQAQAIRESTAANAQSAKDIAQRSSPDGGQRSLSQDMLVDFKRASDEQVRRLGGMEQAAQEKIQSTLQDLAGMQELMKNFNQFESLLQAQQALTDQARAYNRAGQLSREDQLALRQMAATEKEIGDALAALSEKLRANAKAAEKNFPKAAQSGRDLADKIEEARLRALARRATDKMLAADGEASFLSADRLREEMEKLCTACNSQGGRPSRQELDQYLRANRAMNPGQTFAQMMRSKNFMQPGKNSGLGAMMGQGEGMTGESGYAVMAQPALDVMGNETFVTRSSLADRASQQTGLGTAKPGDSMARVDYDQTDTMKNLNPVNRKSGSVVSESLVEEYSEVMDKYFQAITK